MNTADSDTCQTCGDDMNSHMMFTLNPTSRFGIALCPVPGCLCLLTWNAPNQARLPEPEEREAARVKALLDFDSEEIEDLRRRLQAGEIPVTAEGWNVDQ